MLIAQPSTAEALTVRFPPLSLYSGFSAVRLPANKALLPGQRTRLAEPRTAPEFRPRSDAGSLLLLRQPATVFSGSGTETATGAQLRQCPGSSGQA